MGVKLLAKNRPRGPAVLGEDGLLPFSIIKTDGAGLVTVNELGLIDIEYFPTGGAGGLVTYDENGLLTFTDLPSAVQNGLVTYVDGKLSVSILPTGAQGVLILDAGGKIAVADLHGNEADGVCLLDASTQVAESLLAPYYLTKVGYIITYPTSSPPTNYVAYNGAWLTKASYSSLWTAIGDTAASPWSTSGGLNNASSWNQLSAPAGWNLLSDAYNILKIRWQAQWTTNSGGGPNYTFLANTDYFIKYDAGVPCYYAYPSYNDARNETNMCSFGSWMSNSGTARPQDYFKIGTVTNGWIRYQ